MSDTIHEHIRFDPERIGDIIESSVSDCLFQMFGSDLSGADVEQKLVLIEVVAYSLREGGSFRKNLIDTLSWSGRPEMPEVYTSLALQEDEGYKLFALLSKAILDANK